MAEKKTEGRIEVEVGVPEDTLPKPANHFVVAHTDDDFGLDIIYINPYDLHIASKTPDNKVKGEMVARVALSYQNAVKLRDRLNEMIKSYEGKKDD
jgi:hypothetical protein